MKRLKEDIFIFLHNKWYMFCLILTTLCSYGFEICHAVIGIDDTAVALYLEDGLEVAMGRWTIFWLNRIFHLSDFAPFVTELIGAIFLMLAATLFNVLLLRLTNYRSGMLAATIFGCAFVSNPIISEVFVYYWHDGAGLGYVLTALSLLCFHAGLGKDLKTALRAFAGSLLFLWCAAGCYESFLILYILGVLTCLFFRGMERGEGLRLLEMIKYLAAGAAVTVLCVLMRSVMIALTTHLFGLQGVLDQVKQERRGLAEMAGLFGEGGKDQFIMLLKRFWVVYHLNAVVYLPVTVYEIAVFLFAGAAIILTVKKRNISFALLYIGMLIAPFLLTLAEMRLSFYRSCQYLPFYAAAGLWLLARALEKYKKYEKPIRAVLIFAALVIVWNQAEKSNRNFYTDYLKYQHTKEMLLQIASDVEHQYGCDTPVVFVGHYSTPHSLLKDYYVPYTSWQYRYISTMTDLVDEHLKEKYFSVWGYSFIGEANYDFVQWGFDAFDGTNREIMNFLKMHGHSFPLVTKPEVMERAKETGDTMPGWPREGSIRQMDGYVLVHIED